MARVKGRKRALSLRTRFTLFLGLTAFATSAALTVLTYTTARNYLLDQRSTVARVQTYANASTSLNQLKTGATDYYDIITNVRTDDEGFALLVVKNTPYPQKTSFQKDALPVELYSEVNAGRTGQQRFNVDGRPYLGVGVSMPAFDARYFEAFPLATTDRVISYIGTALVVGSIAITVLAAALGWWTSRRLLMPVSRVADAASGIASGGLHTRLEPESDPELNRLTQSFNDMADTMQTRIEREAQFRASDVSHELRSPITALSAAVEVLDARRADLPDRTQQALDVVVHQVRRFDQMVLDLLELSRIDAGVNEGHREELRLEDVVPRIAQRYGFGDVPIDIDHAARKNIWIDKLRLERILANLLDNAREHGGGPTRISIENGKGGNLLLAVEDAGPGVARGERQRIFERFARGTAARHRVGTGLGLALVSEHAHSLEGEAWVEDRPGGGARFVVRFPIDRKGGDGG